MLRCALISILLSPALTISAVAQAQVHVDASMPNAPRPLEPQTEHAAVRDYLQSWQALQSAFEQNRADLLNEDFVGSALDKFTGTIREQSTLGIRTHYKDASHDIQFLFYSPEGLSIEFTDSVKFTLQVFDHGRLISSRQETARYLVVMTPSEVRWRVRILQGMQI